MIRRSFNHPVKRNMDDALGFDFQGLASRVDEPYTMYEDDNEVWTEVISRAAFSDVLSDDVRVLIDHDSSMILGRTKSGTAKIWLDTDGLRYAWKNPETTNGKNIAVSIERGDVDQSSFGFSTAFKDSEWREFEREDGRWEVRRTINRISRLYDVSPVTFAANPDTEVQKNSFEEALKKYRSLKEKREERIEAEHQEQEVKTNINNIAILDQINELNARLASM